jgi:5-methylcytosine-specific restriction endonuclease McrA
MKPAVSLIPARPRVVVEKRKPLTAKERALLAFMQDGMCGCGCGRRLRPPIWDEHIIPLALGGSNEMFNRSLWLRECSLAKTHGKSGDIARTAKAKRLAGETCTGPKRKVHSKGFDRSIRRKMNGTVEKRA